MKDGPGSWNLKPRGETHESAGKQGSLRAQVSFPAAGKGWCVSGGCVTGHTTILPVGPDKEAKPVCGITGHNLYILDMNKLKRTTPSGFIDEEIIVQKGSFSITKCILGSFVNA